MERRHFRNLDSAKKVAEILGCHIVGFDPDWSLGDLADVNPTGDPLLAVARDMTGGYLRLSDLLMGRLAMLLGFDWVSSNPSDEDLATSIELEEKELAKINDTPRMGIPKRQFVHWQKRRETDALKRLTALRLIRGIRSGLCAVDVSPSALQVARDFQREEIDKIPKRIKKIKVSK